LRLLRHFYRFYLRFFYFYPILLSYY